MAPRYHGDNGEELSDEARLSSVRCNKMVPMIISLNEVKMFGIKFLRNHRTTPPVQPTGGEVKNGKDVRISEANERLVKNTRFSVKEINKAFAEARKMQGV